MSIVKIKSGKSTGGILNYCAKEKRERETGEIIERCTHSSNSLGLSTTEKIARAWDLTRDTYNQQGGREYYHVSLNLNPNDTHARNISDTKLHEMAEKFVTEFAPNHNYAIFIHRDKEHPHAHIVFNSVNHETGRKFEDKKVDLYRALEIKDKLDRDYGLEITKRQRSMDRIPDEVQRIHQRDPNAYLWTEDLKHRIGEARKEASSFFSFQQLLNKNGVEADPRGSDGKVSYRFTDEQGKQRQCREAKLGEDYARAAIERDFQGNREQHQSSTREHQHAKDSSKYDAGTEIGAGRDSPDKARGEGIEPDARTRASEPDRDHAGVTQANWESFSSRGDIDEAAQRLRELSKELLGPDRTGTSQTDDSRGAVGEHYTEQHKPRDERHAREYSGVEKANGILLDPTLHYDDSIRNVGMVDKQMAQYSQARSPGHTGDNPHRETDHAQEKEVAYTILEWKHAFDTYSERGIEPRGRDGIPTNDQRRVDRNDQTYQSELVQAFCVSRTFSQRGYEEARRGTRERSGGIFSKIREELSQRIERYGETIRGEIERVVERLRGVRKSAKEISERLGEFRNGVKESQGKQRENAKEIEQSYRNVEHICSTMERETKKIEHSNNHDKWKSRDDLDVGYSIERDDGYEMEM